MVYVFIFNPSFAIASFKIWITKKIKGYKLKLKNLSTKYQQVVGYNVD